MLATSGYIASLVAENVGVGDVLVIVGAVIFAAATWRSSARKALRDDNEDLRQRVETLEEQANADEAVIVDLRGRVVDDDLLRAIVSHMDEQTRLLRAVAVAVIPPGP